MTQSDYLRKAYKLTANPFASKTGPTAEMAGRAREKELWTFAVESRIGAPTNYLNFIIGDYGSGKTLSLYNIHKQFQSSPRVLPVSLTILPEDRVSRFGLDFVQRILRNVPEFIFPRIPNSSIDQLRPVLPEAASLFNRVCMHDLNAFAYLRGEVKLPTKMLAAWGITRKLDSTERATEHLLALLYLIRSIGFESLLVCVDEVEYVFSQMRGANISLVWNTFRKLVDLLDSSATRSLPSLPANLIFFLAISDAGWKRLNDLGRREQSEGGPIQALMRRFGQVIELSPLNKAEGKRLIELRLRQNRLKGSSEKESLIPYDESFVDYVFDLAIGNPGEIVKYSDVALEEGLRVHAALLDRDFASKAFARYGLVADRQEANT